jgi:hypothetical protein
MLPYRVAMEVDDDEAPRVGPEQRVQPPTHRQREEHVVIHVYLFKPPA